MSLLEVRDLDVHHGQLRAVSGFSIRVDAGETVGVIGANGAGKSTLLRSIAGVLRPSSGSIEIDGTDVTRLPAHRRVDHGIALVPEGRRLFKSLTVEENLLSGSYRGKAGPWSLDTVFALFPWMADRRRQSSAQLSGGEQQSVAIARALMTNPGILLIDELSLGLAPVVVQRIYRALPSIVENGCSVLLVEQDVSQALAVADQVHCLLEGRTVLSGRPSELAMKDVEAAYFGIDSASRAG